jgi:hypothetical protein
VYGLWAALTPACGLSRASSDEPCAEAAPPPKVRLLPLLVRAACGLELSVCIRMYVCTCVFYVCACVYACLFVCAGVFVCVCVRARVCVFVRLRSSSRCT